MAQQIVAPAGLQRNTERGYIGGVCAGIAEFLHVDSTWVRAAFVLLSIIGGDLRALPLLGYLVLWVAMPRRDALAGAGSSLRTLTLSMILIGTLLLLLTIGGPGRLGMPVVVAPAIIAVAALALRPDTIRARALLLLVGLGLTATLLIQNYQPVLGSQTIRPHSISELAGGRVHTSLFGDTTIDLTQIQNSSGFMTIETLTMFGDVNVKLPQGASISIETDDGVSLFSLNDSTANRLRVVLKETSIGGSVRIFTE